MNKLPPGYQSMLEALLRIATPVLRAAEGDGLKRKMPVESRHDSNESRDAYSHLEAVGRLLAGVAPYLERCVNSPVGNASGNLGRRFLRLLDSITDPESDDYLNFSSGTQPLVDAAFLAQGLLRAPTALWTSADPKLQENVLRALQNTRQIRPHFNNWLLFSATIEALFAKVGAEWDRMRVDYALRQHDQWYKGDGAYGDGIEFRWDYYNSFVIQPMMLDVLDVVADKDESWRRLYSRALKRSQRYAEVLERMIGPTGEFPPIGRSIAYRGAAFQVLAQLASQERLPNTLHPSQVREGLLAVMRKTMVDDSNFDRDGWLRIGLAGHQPSLGEHYISTGSLYLCSTLLLPLGLDPTNSFWTDPGRPWTQRRIWCLKEDVIADRPL